MSYSPSVRTPSETTSTNEDWQTAIGGYSEDQRSARSRSQSPESARKSPTTFSTDEWHQDSQRQQSNHTHTRSSVLGEQTRIEGSGWSQRGRVSSSANIDRQSVYDDELMKTPQANRRRPHNQDDTMSVISAAPSMVLEELEELRSRINRLEMIPQAAGKVKSEIHNEQRSRPVTQESLQSLRSSTSRDTGLRIANSQSPSHGHPLLREAIQNLRKTNIAMELLRPVDLAVSDAIALSSGVLERNMRLRVDGLCRALTEVCLFLYDHDQSYSQTKLTRTNDSPRLHQANGSPYSHGLRQNNDENIQLTRSRSSRRSLAEILESKSSSRYDDTARSASQASHYRMDTRNSPGDRSYKASLVSNGRQLQSAAGHYTSNHDANRWSPRENRMQTAGSSAGHRRIETFPKGHSRAPSRASTDIIERAPVTRDLLYQRYQRTPPRRDEEHIA